MSDEDKLIPNIDTDGDGNEDSYFDTEDMDQDGYEESVIMYVDTNNDGVFDTEEVMMDTDGDLDIDVDVISTDMNGDGLVDSSTTMADLDNDGFLETTIESSDLDSDGVFDITTEAMTVDSDKDGIFDTIIVSQDTDGDGIFDIVDTYQDVDGDGNLDLIDPQESTEADEINPEQFVIDNPEYDMLNFDPNTNPELVIGDPTEDMEHWEYQQATNRCALFAQLFVIEELTGQEIDIEEFVDTAEANGWFTEEGGTLLVDMNKMLNLYGVENEMTTNGDIEDIEKCLENGGKVIVGVDGDEIWDVNHDTDWYSPSDPNHAIEVIGIDKSDPDNPMVILNDSGHPDGQGMMVPLEQFERAWQDSECEIITAYPEQ